MNTPQKKSTPSIKKSELPKFNKALSKLITNSKKQSSDVLTLSSLIELKYDCNPPTKKHHLKVEISRKLRQGEFL